ncbi:hypothetical protein [Botrimarina sp.]|uniref:hypothetical protein n=1 Tax=Botrimarina sp. TaxID=2795802 RepID=UPI0032ECE5F9
MGKLTSILSAGGYGGDDFSAAWNATEAADDFGPLPPGEYLAAAERGELTTVGAKGTPSYKLTFRVVKGPSGSADHVDRLFWHDVWLTPAALPQAKRDLGKLGVTELSQLERPLPPGIVCRVRLALRRDDDGAQRNRVVRFDVDHVAPPQADPYAPTDGADGAPADGPQQAEGETDAA